MRFNWIDITDKDFPIIESWLDDETKYFTGLEDGIKDYYDFYLNDEHYIFGDNFWIKVIFENSIPIIRIPYNKNFTYSTTLYFYDFHHITKRACSNNAASLF